MRNVKPPPTRKPDPAPRPAEAARTSGVLARVRQLQGELPPTARRIAAFIDIRAEEVIRMSITELSELTEASEGSIVGLCRRFGASGFQELKILIARDLVEPVQFIQEDLHEGDSPAQVSDRIFGAHAASLAETRRLLSVESLAGAVSILRSAERIEVYGIGSAAPIAQDLAYRLLQLGLHCAAFVDSHVQAVSAAMCGPEAATVTISHSGSTTETVLATRLAKEAGARTIGITKLGKSPLARHCDILLHTVANETRYRPEAMSSRVAQLAIIDTLVSCCALAEPKRSIANLQRSARVIAEKRY
jgi:DNA-binding MurR/RpiR family transcriptional regulator